MISRPDRDLQKASLGPLSIRDFEYTDHQEFFQLIRQSLEQDATETGHYVEQHMDEDLRDLFAELSAQTIQEPLQDRLVAELFRSVIRLRRVPFADITGLQTLEEAIEELEKRGVAVVLCEANPRLRGQMAKAGILKLVGEGNYSDGFAAALERCRTLLDPEKKGAHQRGWASSGCASEGMRGLSAGENGRLAYVLAVFSGHFLLQLHDGAHDVFGCRSGH